MKKFLFSLTLFSCGNHNAMQPDSYAHQMNKRQREEMRLMSFLTKISFTQSVQNISAIVDQTKSMQEQLAMLKEHGLLHAQKIKKLESDIQAFKNEAQIFGHDLIELLKKYFKKNCHHMSKERINELCSEFEAILEIGSSKPVRH